MLGKVCNWPMKNWQKRPTLRPWKNIATINALRYRSHDQLWSSRYESALTSLTQAKQLAETLSSQ